MKYAATALAVAILASAATPTLAQTSVEPSAPADTPPVVLPNDGATPPMVVVPFPEPGKTLER
jgi:hypothetical protein